MTSTPGPIPAAARPPGPLTLPGTDPWWIVSPGAVAAWAAVQVGALAVALAQVPLAAKYPAGSSLTPEVLLAAQVGGGALLCPMLFRTPATALVVLASAWPTLLLAGGVAARPLGETAVGGLAVSAWLATLFVWIAALPTRGHRQTVAAAGTLLAVGGALLAYLATEFSAPSDPADSLPLFLRATPLLLSWAVGHSSGRMWGDALPLAGLLLAGAALWRVRTVYDRRSSASLA